jgi:hypothetical protein
MMHREDLVQVFLPLLRGVIQRFPVFYGACSFLKNYQTLLIGIDECKCIASG